MPAKGSRREELEDHPMAFYTVIPLKRQRVASRALIGRNIAATSLCREEHLR